MSCDGQAPKFFSRRNRNGVPYWSVAVVLAISLLGYCQLSCIPLPFTAAASGIDESLPQILGAGRHHLAYWTRRIGPARQLGRHVRYLDPLESRAQEPEHLARYSLRSGAFFRSCAGDVADALRCFAVAFPAVCSMVRTRVVDARSLHAGLLGVPKG